MQEDDSKELSVITISLRLDAVVSAVTKLSRSQVKKMIEDGEVKLNWHLVAQSNIIVSDEIINLTTTKKGKKRLEIKAWQAKKR